MAKTEWIAVEQRWPNEEVRVQIRTVTGIEDCAFLTDNQLMYEGEPPYWVGENDTYELNEVKEWKELAKLDQEQKSIK